jgi:hypothetical protein
MENIMAENNNGSTTVDKPMAENQILNLANQFIEALHALETNDDSEAEPVAILFGDEAVLRNSALDHMGQEISGRDAILQFWIQYKAELGKCKSNFHHITTSERAAGLFWTTEGTSPGGQNVHYHGATLLEFDDSGLIKFFRGYYDTRELVVKADVGG